MPSINPLHMIGFMREIDHLHLNGHLLRTLLTVLDTGGVGSAATRLGVTQSTVSHQIDTLRAISGDPLLVKSGRGVVATERARDLAVQARALLDAMARFAQGPQFDPAHWQGRFTIAANDFQRDVLLPPLMRRLRTRAPHLSLRILPSGVPTPEMLRQQQCDLVISPRPPDGTDIVQKRLFEDRYRVFYDPARREAPRDLAEYLAAEHATVVYESQRALELDQWMEARAIARRIRVMVPGFSGLAPFVRDSELLATAPRLMRSHWLAGLASAEMPLACPPIAMYLVWHRRHHQDPAHRWMRAQLEAVCANAIRRADQAPGSAPEDARSPPARAAAHRAGSDAAPRAGPR